MSFSCRLLSVLVLAAAPVSAAVFPMKEFNLVVLQNLNSTSEVEGRAFIGGNLSGTSNYATQINPAPSVQTLIVGGTIQGTANVSKGSVTVGTAVTGIVNRNGGAGTSLTVPAAVNVAGVAGTLEAATLGFAALPTNGTVQAPSGQPGPLKFIVPNTTRAVFEVSGSLFSSNLVQQIEIVGANNAQEIIIDVLGTSVNFNGGNLIGDFGNNGVRAKILWNFSQATSVSVNRQFGGAILAPFAHLTNSTEINGSVAVKSFNQNGEVHLPISLVNPVFIPEPSVLGLSALAVPMLTRRRKVA